MSALFLVIKNQYSTAQIGLMEADSKEALMEQLGIEPVPADLLGGSHMPEIQIAAIGEFVRIPTRTSLFG